MNAARSKYKRATWYDAIRMDPYVISLFTTREPAEHDKLKAQMAFGYGGKENPSIEADIDEQLAGLLDLIRRKYVSTATELRPMDFAQRINFFTLDVITKIAYGRAFGYLATDSDVYEYIETARAHIPVIASLGDVPWLAALVFSSTGLKIVGPKTTDKKGIGRMMAYVPFISSFPSCLVSLRPVLHRANYLPTSYLTYLGKFYKMNVC